MRKKHVAAGLSHTCDKLFQPHCRLDVQKDVPEIPPDLVPVKYPERSSLKLQLGAAQCVSVTHESI